MTKISIIVAADENNAIGNNNNLLCHLPNDLKYFKAITNGHSIIMGRKTFESLPKGALPNRRNIVISRNENLEFNNCEVCSSLQEAIDLCKNEKEVFIIGGGTVYNEAINLCDKIYITRIHNRFNPTDTFFPEINTSDWKEVYSEDHEADESNKYSYSFKQFEKFKTE